MTTIPVGARSALLTLLGWVFSVCGALGTLSVAGWSVARDSPLRLALAVAVCLLLVAMGVGLLRRDDWARRLFIGLLLAALAAQALGWWAWWAQLQTMLGLPAAAAGVLSALAFVGLGAAVVWAIRRLMSRRVRLEFV